MPEKQYKQQWQVESHRDRHKEYTVSISKDGILECSCPDCIYRHGKEQYYQCKHIREVVSKYAFKLVYDLLKDNTLSLDEIKERVTPYMYSIDELAVGIIKAAAEDIQAEH
jgi:predicted nucleic acid-binding Zn finger protein